MKYIQQSEVDWSQKEEVSKETGSPCFSLQWTRRTMIKAWKKVVATWTSQGSHHTEILGDIKIQCIGAIGSSLRREDCNFVKHEHTQSLCTTHYLRFALRQRHAWRLRWSHTITDTNLQSCLVLCWSRIRKANICQILKEDHKIHSTKRNTSNRTYVVQVETNKGPNNHQARSCMARSLDENW